jgi:16S rRNA (cytidine1402-2'-O)-methyltransferase
VKSRPASTGAGSRHDPAGHDLADHGAATAAEAGMRGSLYVVATPIGNLGDITFRAVEVLKAVPLVAAEDTRLTRRLFSRYEIGTPLVSYHAQSSKAREVELLDHLRSGRDLALVTDAGTPLVSDPGGELTAAWAEEGGTIVPIPGASAVLAALVASGLAAAHWSFEGFLPRSGKERRLRLARIAADERACVIYEAPPRVAETLADLAVATGGARRLAICRELTKMHEEIVRGPVGELARAAAHGEIMLRGEFVLVLEALSAAEASARDLAEDPPMSMEDGRTEVALLIAGGMKRSDAVRQIAASSGLDRRELYRPD